MPKRILVAEDDKFLANAYKAKLEKSGFEVVIAQTGEEVLSLLEKEGEASFNVILLDLIMPKKDGFDTLREIKANQKFKDIPVLVASNLGQEEDIKKGKKLGAAEYIVKSNVALKDLVEKIEKILAWAGGNLTTKKRLS